MSTQLNKQHKEIVQNTEGMTGEGARGDGVARVDGTTSAPAEITEGVVEGAEGSETGREGQLVEKEERLMVVGDNNRNALAF